jgi:hypothetical protein
MQSLFGFAQVKSQTGAKGRAAALLRIVIDHPATEEATRVEARSLLQQDEENAAGAREARWTLEEMVRDLLAE